MARSNDRHTKLAGKTILFIYDSPHKCEAVETVFTNAGMRCDRIYARDVPHAELKLRQLHKRKQDIDLIVCDFDLTDDPIRKPAETGGDFYERLREGGYDKWFANRNSQTIPFVFDSGEDKPERYRGRKNTFIRTTGDSLPLTCIAAVNHAKQQLTGDGISRPPSFYPSEAEIRDMYADQGGYIGNDNAHLRHQQRLLAKREEKAKERGK